MQTATDDAWPRIQAELARAVDESTYRIWLAPLRPLPSDADGHLQLLAPSRMRDWIAERFGRVIQTAAAAVLGPDLFVDIVSDAAPLPAARERRPERAPTSKRAAAAARSSDSTLNPKLTFDQFVIGDANRLAHAAALAVAELPGQTYNPLFICGPPGLGKTHLLHSVGAFVRAHGGGLTVRYTTGEAFTNAFLAALSGKAIEDFKACFRGVDLLLLDDVHFLERKTRTEEEFFHTFNALYDQGSQIVLTSDRPPRDLQGLEDRLRERFAAGLVADIAPPDLPTRLTILRKRVHQDHVEVADSTALETLARRVTDNVRSLEGALIRTVAYASLTGRRLDTDLAEEVLDGLYPRLRRERRSVAEIQAAACEHFELSAEELVSASRAQRLAWPRQVAMYLARELTSESLPAIGRHFGGRDHTTVLHAWRRITERIENDARAHQTVAELRALLDAPARPTPDRSS